MTAMQSIQANEPTTLPAPATDASGYPVFSMGTTGKEHVVAHRMFDEGKILPGYNRLGDWLDLNSGRDSDWIHLNFHQAVFELEVGDWTEAYERYLDELLPHAGDGLAITDAPQLAWRLALQAPRPLELYWDVLRSGALANSVHPLDDWSQLHLMLSIVGAGDIKSLGYWKYPSLNGSPGSLPALTARFAESLEALASGYHAQAGDSLLKLVPQIQQAGGSAAQNQLFPMIARSGGAGNVH